MLMNAQVLTSRNTDDAPRVAPETTGLVSADRLSSIQESALPMPIELTTGQQFEIERLSRAIDATADPEELRRLAKRLLHAWHTQKAATNWVIRQQVEPGFSRPDDL